MKYRFGYRMVSQRSALRSYYNVVNFRTYSWKGLRYVYFRKILAGEFRPGIRLANDSATGNTQNVNGIKLSKNSPKGERESKSAMRFRDVVSLLWRALSEARSTRPPSTAARDFVGVRPPMQAGLAPKIANLEPKSQNIPMPDNNDIATHEIRAAEPADFELHGELKKNKERAKEEKLDLSELETAQENQVPRVEKGRAAGVANDVILYANRIPQLLSGLLSNLNWKIFKLSDDNKNPMQTPTERAKDRAVATIEVSLDTEPVVIPVPVPPPPQDVHSPAAKLPWKRAQRAVWASAEAGASRTRYLMRAVATSLNPASQTTRIQDFCKHLAENPQAKSLAVKERAIPLMLRIRALTRNPEARGFINEALALLGYIGPLPSRGIRILSIDGGGTRGVMALEILRKFEIVTQQPVHRLFDFMCGVSTGAILSVLLGAMKASMDECEELYKQTSSEIFNQSTWLGTGKLVFNHAFYDTDAWVKVLQKNIGECPLIHTARDPECPKIAAVSTIVNEPRLKAFLFRNYEYPHRYQSQFPGSYTPQLWEAIRASAAAPGYFEEYKLGDFVHQDGGILTNNPSALAIHECRHLWPGQDIQCVISLGNGRYEPQVPANVSTSSLKTKLLKIVDSATDTEGVHMILNDLLPPKRYYRFNPYLTDAFSLDEIRPEKFKQLQNDAQMYIRKNEHKINEAAAQLLEPKSHMQRMRDSIKEKVMTFM